MDPLKAPAPQESKLHFLDYWRIIRIRKTVILAVFLLVVITATLVTLILPERYASTARIRVERDQTDITSLTEPNAVRMYDPYFIQTEFELIRSEVILGRVIKDLDLNNEWGRRYNAGQPLKTTETMALLKANMDLSPVRNTEVIEIKVLDEKPDEAARLANAIASAYKDYRSEKRREMSEGGIDKLKDQLDKQEVDVLAAQTNVDQLRMRLHISDTTPGGEGSSMLLTTETLKQLESMRIQQQANLAQEEQMLNRLRELKTNDFNTLVETIPTAMQDTLLSSLLEERTMAEQKYVAVEKEFGPEHVEVLKAKDSVLDLYNKITNRVNGILEGIQAKVDSQKAYVGELNSQVENAKQKDIDEANLSQPYWEAKRKLDELMSFRRALYMKLASEQTDQALPKTGMVVIMDPAVRNDKAVRPNKPLNIALGVIIGLVVGVGLAFFIEYLDTSVKTIDDVERSLQSPVLGVIPQNVGLMIDEGAESPHAEAYRVLRTNLLFTRKDEKLNTVAVVSAGAGEGKSTTVCNLASVFAQGGQRVLMVDSDLRRPTLHKMLKVSNSLGLTNYLLKQNSLEEVIQTTSLPSLDFMASGKLPSSSLGILSSGQMREVIGELKKRYDFVFFDSPPVMGVSDASILASEVDMTLQVIQYRRYPQPMNIRAKQLIEKVGGNLVGIVLNNINMSQDESYYYYSGYYQDYYSRDEEQEPGHGDEGQGDKPKVDLKPKY